MHLSRPITFLSAGFALLIAVSRADKRSASPAAKAPAKKSACKTSRRCRPMRPIPPPRQLQRKPPIPRHLPLSHRQNASCHGPEPPAYRPPDAATQTISDSNSKTPQELVQVVISLTALEHPELAKPFVQQLIAAKFDPDTAADNIHRFGIRAPIQLAGDPPAAARSGDVCRPRARVGRGANCLATPHTASRSRSRRCFIASTCMRSGLAPLSSKPRRRSYL